MKVFELFESARDDERLKEDFRMWKKLMNLSPATVARLLDAKDPVKSGTAHRESKPIFNTKTARASARAILRMRSKALTEWSDADINWMHRHLSYISKSSYLDSPLYKTDSDGKKIPSARLKNLWSFGHYPLGHSPSNYGIFK